MNLYENIKSNLKEEETSTTPSLENIVNALKDAWNNNIEVEGSNNIGYKKYFKEKYGWDVSTEDLNKAWDIAASSYDNGEPESKSIEIEGKVITSKAEAKEWFDNKIKEYKNTYYFPDVDKANLDKLTNVFGNTYFWENSKLNDSDSQLQENAQDLGVLSLEDVSHKLTQWQEGKIAVWSIPYLHTDRIIDIANVLNKADCSFELGDTICVYSKVGNIFPSGRCSVFSIPEFKNNFHIPQQ